METIPPPEIFYIAARQIACEGIGGALGHPRVWLNLGQGGQADCGYCDRRFILEGGPADTRAAEVAAPPTIQVKPSP